MSSLWQFRWSWCRWWCRWSRCWSVRLWPSGPTRSDNKMVRSRRSLSLSWCSSSILFQMKQIKLILQYTLVMSLFVVDVIGFALFFHHKIHKTSVTLFKSASVITMRCSYHLLPWEWIDWGIRILAAFWDRLHSPYWSDKYSQSSGN